MQNKIIETKVALFSAPCKYIDDVLALVKRNGYVEWDLNTLPFSLSTKRMAYVRDFIKENGDVRFIQIRIIIIVDYSLLLNSLA